MRSSNRRARAPARVLASPWAGGIHAGRAVWCARLPDLRARPLVVRARGAMLASSMNTFSVWCFPDPDAAERLVCRLDGVTIDDAALVSWPPRRRTPATRVLGSITGPGKLWGGFWGMLLGLIFLTP